MDVWDLEDPTPYAVCCQQIDDRWVEASKTCLFAVWFWLQVVNIKFKANKDKTGKIGNHKFDPNYWNNSIMDYKMRLCLNGDAYLLVLNS